MAWDDVQTLLDFLDASMYLRDIKKMPKAKAAMKKLILKRTKAEDEHDDEMHWNELRRARVHLDAVAMLLFRVFTIRSITILRG